MYSFTVYTHKKTDAFRVVAGEHTQPTDAELFNVRVYQGADRQAALDVAYSDERDVRIKSQIERFGVSAPKMIPCGYSDCDRFCPPTYGKPGVALSRFDNKTLICSHCGVAESMGKAFSLLRTWKPKSFVSFGK